MSAEPRAGRQAGPAALAARPAATAHRPAPRPIGRAAADPGQIGFAPAERGVALLLLVMIPVHAQIHSGISFALLACLGCLPLWIRALAAYRGARTVMVLVIACLVSGVVLAQISAADHVVTRSEQVGSLALLLTFASGIGVVLWARQLWPTPVIGCAFGLGLLVDGVSNPGALGAGNPWKFVYAIPVTVLVLALASARRNRMVELGAILILGLVSTVTDARSYFGTALLTFILLIWQLRPRLSAQRRSWVWTAGLMVVLGASLYSVGTSLLVSGYLGTAAQTRSVAQISQSGSVILGGRPELAATIALFEEHPLGYGAGVVPSGNDVAAAKAGLAGINYDPNNGYVDQYLFGSKFELHSIVGDLWAVSGFAGIALCVVIVGLLFRSIASYVATREASGLILFLGLYTLWNVLFSPVLAALPTAALAIGLALFAEPSPPRSAPLSPVGGK